MTHRPTVCDESDRKVYQVRVASKEKTRHAVIALSSGRSLPGKLSSVPFQGVEFQILVVERGGGGKYHPPIFVFSEKQCSGISQGSTNSRVR
jgi:hypothetical protein